MSSPTNVIIFPPRMTAQEMRRIAERHAEEKSKPNGDPDAPFDRRVADNALEELKVLAVYSPLELRRMMKRFKDWKRRNLD